MNLSAIVLEALQLALWLTAPALAACLLVAAVVGLFQAATQANDPSLAFVPKLGAVLTALWFGRTFLSERLVQFSLHVLREMSQLGN